jgi:hypothetical protein
MDGVHEKKVAHIVVAFQFRRLPGPAGLMLLVPRAAVQRSVALFDKALVLQIRDEALHRASDLADGTPVAQSEL